MFQPHLHFMSDDAFLPPLNRIVNGQKQEITAQKLDPV